jgi:hypothetical protein
MTEKEKSKRKPSAYNIFVAKGVKNGKTFAECAKLWKKQKGKK